MVPGPATLDYDRLAADYARHRTVHPEVLRDLLVTGRVGSASRVLEVGCGTGNYVVAVEAQAGCACWAIDPSEQMLARARPRASRIVFARGAAERLEFPDGNFDLVYSVDVIHHVDDRSTYFREAHRVLRPGGRICTVTDSEWIIRHREPLAVYFPETVEVELRRYPRIAVLAEAMVHTGFVEIREVTMEFPYEITDARAYRDRAFSSLHLISPEAFRRGLARLEADLCAGPVRGASRYLLLWGAQAGDQQRPGS